MSFACSYDRCRNPPRLLKEFGFCGQVRSKKDEDHYLSLVRQDASLLYGLCLVMGGFMDGILGKAYALIEILPEEIRKSFDVYYREHDEGEAARKLILCYGEASKPIIAIGHSWGGSTLARDVLGNLGIRQIPITALVTLDPVGIRPPVSLSNVCQWLNVYVDYRVADWRRQNLLARIGKPWGKVPYADDNHVFLGQNHANAVDMFLDYGVSFLHPLVQ